MFACDSEGLCAQCKMKGRLGFCPVFKTECRYAKNLPLPDKDSSKKRFDKSVPEKVIEKDRELE